MTTLDDFLVGTSVRYFLKFKFIQIRMSVTVLERTATSNEEEYAALRNALRDDQQIRIDDLSGAVRFLSVLQNPQTYRIGTDVIFAVRDGFASDSHGILYTNRRSDHRLVNPVTGAQQTIGVVSVTDLLDFYLAANKWDYEYLPVRSTMGVFYGPANACRRYENVRDGEGWRSAEGFRMLDENHLIAVGDVVTIIERDVDKKVHIIYHLLESDVVASYMVAMKSQCSEPSALCSVRSGLAEMVAEALRVPVCERSAFLFLLAEKGVPLFALVGLVIDCFRREVLQPWTPAHYWVYFSQWFEFPGLPAFDVGRRKAARRSTVWGRIWADLLKMPGVVFSYLRFLDASALSTFYRWVAGQQDTAGEMFTKEELVEGLIEIGSAVGADVEVESNKDVAFSHLFGTRYSLVRLAIGLIRGIMEWPVKHLRRFCWRAKSHTFFDPLLTNLLRIHYWHERFVGAVTEHRRMQLAGEDGWLGWLVQAVLCDPTSLKMMTIMLLLSDVRVRKLRSGLRDLEWTIEDVIESRRKFQSLDAWHGYLFRPQELSQFHLSGEA